MKYAMEPDYPVTDEAATAATGKTLNEWFAELDKWGALEKGRRETNVHLYNQKIDPWWCTTIAVEYEKHKEQKKKDGLYEGYFICSTKTINAPVDRVYQAWANENDLAQWLGEGAKAEAKDGGKITTSEGENFSLSRVRENKDLRFSFEREGFSTASQVDVLFQDKGKGKTGLLVNHARLQERSEADAARRAWAEALDKLKAVCES